MEQDPFLDKALKHSKKTLYESVYSCLFPCFKKSNKDLHGDGVLSLEDGNSHSNSNEGGEERYKNQIRSLELQLQQVDQKFAALTLAKQRAEQLVEKERNFKLQAEEALALERRNSSQNKINAIVTPEAQKEMENLKQQIQRSEKKLATLEKYNQDIELQLKNTNASAASSASQISLLQQNVEAEKTKVAKLTAELNTLKSTPTPSASVGNDAALDKKIAELEATIKELKDEIEFRDSLGSKMDQNESNAPSQGTGVGGPVRATRGRVPIASRVAALNTNAPNNNNAPSPNGPPPPISRPSPPSNTPSPSPQPTPASNTPSPAPQSPPSVPSRNALSDRMKAFQNLP